MGTRGGLIYEGEVKKMANSYYVRIPADQVRSLGLSGGSQLKMYRTDEDDLILSFAKAERATGSDGTPNVF